MNDVILDVKNLKVSFKSQSGWLEAVPGVSFSVAKGQCIGLVGESGSGKSVTNLAIMGLLDKSKAKIQADHIKFCAI